MLESGGDARLCAVLRTLIQTPTTSRKLYRLLIPLSSFHSSPSACSNILRSFLRTACVGCTPMASSSSGAQGLSTVGDGPVLAGLDVDMSRRAIKRSRKGSNAGDATIVEGDSTGIVLSIFHKSRYRPDSRQCSFCPRKANDDDPVCSDEYMA